MKKLYKVILMMAVMGLITIQSFSQGGMGHFMIGLDEDGDTVDEFTGGNGYGGQWYFYENTVWWNMWFLNEPFIAQNHKVAFISFRVVSLYPGILSNLTVVVNWSTPWWSWPEPQNPPAPPIPPLTAGQEEMMIARSQPLIMINNQMIPHEFPGIPVEVVFPIWDYNPEWISMDVRGTNVWVTGMPTEQGVLPGSIIHVCLPPADTMLREYGDAPEGAVAYLETNTIGNFPTCVYVGPAGSFIRHGFPSATYFGFLEDGEPDGNAGWCPIFAPNQYDSDECWFGPPAPNFDEGLMTPIPFSIVFGNYVPCAGQGEALDTACAQAVWGPDIDIWVNSAQGFGGFVNVLADWNRDGQWALDPNTTCAGNPVPEHVLVNFPIPPGFMGPLSALAPPPFTVGPKQGHVWFRFSFTEVMVAPNWDGAGVFNDGETEDYLIYITKKVIPLATWPIFLAIGLIALATFIIWWRKK